jgi:hypothetical protein
VLVYEFFEYFFNFSYFLPFELVGYKRIFFLAGYLVLLASLASNISEILIYLKLKLKSGKLGEYAG